MERLPSQNPPSAIEPGETIPPEAMEFFARLFRRREERLRREKQARQAEEAS